MLLKNGKFFLPQFTTEDLINLLNTGMDYVLLSNGITIGCKNGSSQNYFCHSTIVLLKSDHPINPYNSEGFMVFTHRTNLENGVNTFFAQYVAGDACETYRDPLDMVPLENITKAFQSLSKK